MQKVEFEVDSRQTPSLTALKFSTRVTTVSYGNERAVAVAQ